MKTKELKALAVSAYGLNIQTDPFDELPDDATNEQIREVCSSIKQSVYFENCDRESAASNLLSEIERIIEDEEAS